ncbi:aquaporin-like protein [Clathrospora elynae]|uniref:Aquaporin-like protein n=1 Tax=Clathrospora elynae TaxID=706981 RepID=A0A6A5SS88_9PLEO|nr:aquaporin-like protein [Clathrospora elynae]
MAQSNSTLPQFYGQQLHDGTIAESPGAIAPPQRGSDDSRRELLRLPVQPHPAHIDLHMEQEPHVTSADQINALGLVPRTAKMSALPDSQGFKSPGLGRRQSQDARRVVPYSPAINRNPYMEEYFEEVEQYSPPRQYRRRPGRRQQRPPVSYNNSYAEHQGSKYGPLPRNSVDNHSQATYDTTGKPNYEMYYPSEDEYGPRRRPVMRGGGSSRGPPRPPVPTEGVMRLPWIIWMGSNAKNHFVAFVGEFVGTTMFLFFAFSGTQVANIGSSAPSSDNTTTGEAAGFSPIVLLYIALVFSFSLMVNVWIFFRISGGLFNPAVTFAMLLCKALSPIRAFMLVTAQISGSIFASFLVSVLFPTRFNVRTTLGEGTSLVQGVFIEAILTAELVFTIVMLAMEKHKATFIAPVGIGLALFIAELVGVYYTGGSLNPARSFGPCVVTGVFDLEHWIYWVGPAAGAIIAVVFYKFIKILEYEVANPGQDDDDKDQESKEREGSAIVDVESGVEVKKKKEGQGFGGRGEGTY